MPNLIERFASSVLFCGPESWFSLRCNISKRNLFLHSVASRSHIPFDTNVLSHQNRTLVHLLRQPCSASFTMDLDYHIQSLPVTGLFCRLRTFRPMGQYERCSTWSRAKDPGCPIKKQGSPFSSYHFPYSWSQSAL